MRTREFGSAEADDPRDAARLGEQTIAGASTGGPPAAHSPLYYRCRIDRL